MRILVQREIGAEHRGQRARESRVRPSVFHKVVDRVRSCERCSLLAGVAAPPGAQQKHETEQKKCNRNVNLIAGEIRFLITKCDLPQVRYTIEKLRYSAFQL